MFVLFHKPTKRYVGFSEHWCRWELVPQIKDAKILTSLSMLETLPIEESSDWLGPPVERDKGDFDLIDIEIKETDRRSLA